MSGEPVSGDDERPGTPDAGAATVRPAIDVQRHTDESGYRAVMPTLSDEVATEQARIASVLMDSTPPVQGGANEVTLAFRPALVAGRAIDDPVVAALRAELAPLARVPSLVRALTELKAVIDEPKTAYVLGFVDGLLPLETILDVVGLPELDTLRILRRAIEQGVIRFDRVP